MAPLNGMGFGLAFAETLHRRTSDDGASAGTPDTRHAHIRIVARRRVMKMIHIPDRPGITVVRAGWCGACPATVGDDHGVPDPCEHLCASDLARYADDDGGPE